MILQQLTCSGGGDGLLLHVASCAAATRRAAGVSRPLPVFALRAARRGGPGGVPTTPGAARTVRSRPDASELENCVKKRVFRPQPKIAALGAKASLLLAVTSCRVLARIAHTGESIASKRDAPPRSPAPGERAASPER